MQITERYRRRDFGHMDLEMTSSLRSLRCAHTFAASLMLNGTLKPGGVPFAENSDIVLSTSIRFRSRFGLSYNRETIKTARPI